MDRFSWTNSSSLLAAGESGVHRQSNVRLYDGDHKTSFDEGDVRLTTHRMIWDDSQQEDRTIHLQLNLVTKVEEVQGGFLSSPKLVLHLLKPPSNKESGPCVSSSNNFIKLSFRQGGHSQFHEILKQQLSKKIWEKTTVGVSPSAGKTTKPGIKPRGPGIVGIERNLEQRSKQTDHTISQAFKDLDALMEKAKEMVDLADKFASKIEEKKGGITDDETVMFKSYLLSLGISNPVTRETHGSGASYHKELAKELATFLEPVIKAEGGMMSLSDVYCRFNRARGIELVSPEDVTNAARQFEAINVPLRLRKFDSGVLVIQIVSHSDREVIKSTKELLDAHDCLTAEELAKLLSISVMLAKERLLVTEDAGKACRDDSVEGLKFYPNWFLEKAA